MKNFIFTVLLICNILASATTHQIANQAAFVAFNPATLAAGDQLLFAKGQMFYGTLPLTISGTSSSRIVLGAYGTGANPVISGFTTVTEWTNLGSNIWESTNAVSSLATCNMVVINGVNAPMGRTPNTGSYYTINSHSGATSITSSSLSGSPDWTGAEVIVRTNQWLMNRRVITSQSGGTLNFPALQYDAQNNYKFFIQNDARTLDQQNEWYYNPTTKKIRIYSTFQPTSVKVSTVENLVLMKSDYITIQNINFEGANNCAIYNDNFTSYNLTVQDCNISYSGLNSIQLKNQGIVIERCSINYSNNYGIFMKHHNSNTTIRDCNISNSGMFPSIGDGFISCGMNIPAADNAVIERNSIVNSGYCGIATYGNNQLIKNNFVDNFCSVLQDGGGIYMTANTTTTKNDVIGNIVMNGIGATAMLADNDKHAIGVYLDAQSTRINVIGNTVYNCNGDGILGNNSSYCVFRGNTSVFNSVQFKATRYTTSTICQSNKVKQNILVSKATQWVAFFQSPLTSATEIINSTIFELDSNLYCRPIDDFASRPLPGYEPIALSQASVGNQYYKFGDWGTRIGQEFHGGKSPVAVNSEELIQFMYNETATTKNVVLNHPSVDMKGNKITGVVTLDPFSSKVFLKDPNPAPSPVTGVNHPAKANGKFGMVGNRPGLR